MAAKFRKIDPRIWNDERFAGLSERCKLFVFWLLTGSRVNRCGVVAWSPGLCSEETGIPRAEIDTVLDTVSHTMEWPVDKPAKLVFLPKWWKYNQPPNADALRGAMADLEDMPRNDLKSAMVKARVHIKVALRGIYDTVLDTVYNTEPDTVSTTVSAQEKEKEQEKEREKAGPGTVAGKLFQRLAAMVKLDKTDTAELDRASDLIGKMLSKGLTAADLDRFPGILERLWPSCRSIDLGILEQKWKWLVDEFQPDEQPRKGKANDGSDRRVDEPARKLRTTTVSA